ncbi:phosphate transport system permease protein [Entomoplasma freundtii]|uniref:Phosphate transport system permease protein PstA n=1 Tax=Entomoplasma freundtii TaxID=74700 RepID=A0A2K8NR06_9MOLU|nr:phosphate ABC transporter permease PstA [Entomoplasma freundtii]ATZ16249.1 phosphate ABC transporter permease [Entomoplasma freundtii]TDY56850.1 phosphate transport system permease protein [Entomoplasma freundtii]
MAIIHQKKSPNPVLTPPKEPKNFDVATAKAKKRAINAISFKVLIYVLTILIVALIFFLIGYIIYSSVPMYRYTSFWKFIFTANWKPKDNQFGIGMIIGMTLMLLFITMLFAVPLTIFSTVFIIEYLSKRGQKIAITLIQLLAGIPSVVFGLFAREYIGALFRLMGAPSNDNLMVAALTMTFMAIPTMVSLSYNALKSVPEGYRYGSLALGISREKTAFTIILRSASTKIITAVILGISRVIGETMAIMMIAGNASGGFDNSSFSGFLFSSIRTLASTIGLEISETSSSQHKAALFAIATFLFIMVFLINLTVLMLSNISRSHSQRANKLRQKAQLKIANEEMAVQKRQKVEQTKSKRQIKTVHFKKPLLASSHNQDEDLKSYHPTYSATELGMMVNLKTKNKFWKKAYSIMMLFLMGLSVAIVLFFIIWILGTIIIKGLIALGTPSAFISINGQDGIFAALFTTILLVVATLFFAIPLALAAAIYLFEYANPASWVTKSLRFIINLLSSTPSIIFGIFGLQVFIVLLKLPFSIFASSLTMTIVILPMLITNFEDALSSVPEGYREAGAGLGMTNLQQLFRIILPYAREGLMTGIILAMARIIGESAPVYLTLGTAIRMPAEGFLSQGATLTTAIYMLAAEAQPGKGQESIYLLALITVLLVFALNIGIQKIATFFTKNNDSSGSHLVTLKAKMKNISHKFQSFSFERWRIRQRASWRNFKKRVKYFGKWLKLRLSWKHIKETYQAWRERRQKFNKIKKKEEI